MVYSLVYLALRRNLRFSSKPLSHADYILQKRLPSILGTKPLAPYCTKKEEKKGEKKEKKNEERPSLTDGRSHVNYIISQAKKGKISMTEITTLVQRVITEGQYKEYTKAPQTIQTVGLASLVPMLGIPLLTLLSGHASLYNAHMTYATTVLSFLGGSNWYDAISKGEVSYEKLTWCITPQLIGWTSLILPLPLGMLLTSFGFCLSLIHDVLLTSYPQWLKSLRLVLTAGTLLSFMLMFVLYL